MSEEELQFIRDANLAALLNRATAAEAKVAVLRDELRMAVAIISAELPHAPMLANFRKALQETANG